MPITYEQIKSVNERVSRIEIRGKKYASVAARVQAFRELFPNGSIVTTHERVSDGTAVTYIFTATACDGSGSILATGTASEDVGSTQINRTSALENAETSAVGRCLGFLGIGSETSMASAEEMVNALYQQEHMSDSNVNQSPSKEENLEIIKGLFQQNGKTSEEAVAWVEKRFGLPLDKVSKGQMANAKVALVNGRTESK